jgi:hypothetical protein
MIVDFDHQVVEGKEAPDLALWRSVFSQKTIGIVMKSAKLEDLIVSNVILIQSQEYKQDVWGRKFK